VSCAGYEEWKKAKCLEVFTETGAIFSITWDRDDEETRHPLSPGSVARRRHAIYYLFVEVFGAPKKEDWTAPNFHLRLSLPAAVAAAGHHGHVQHPGHQQGGGHHGHGSRQRRARGEEGIRPVGCHQSGARRQVLVEDYIPQAEVVYRVMESGMGLGNTVVVLNQWSRWRTLEPASCGCLQRFVRSSAVMVLEKRETIKAGSKDEGAAWAWARCQFAQQLKRQFCKGARIAAGQEHAPASPPGAPRSHGGLRGPPGIRGGRGGGGGALVRF